MRTPVFLWQKLFQFLFNPVQHHLTTGAEIRDRWVFYFRTDNFARRQRFANRYCHLATTHKKVGQCDVEKSINDHGHDCGASDIRQITKSAVCWVHPAIQRAFTLGKNANRFAFSQKLDVVVQRYGVIFLAGMYRISAEHIKKNSAVKKLPPTESFELFCRIGNKINRKKF